MSSNITDPGMSLAQMHRSLVHRLGDAAPALITIKRHAATGILRPLTPATTAAPATTGPAKTKSKAHKRYSLAQALHIYKHRAEGLAQESAPQIPQVDLRTRSDPAPPQTAQAVPATAVTPSASAQASASPPPAAAADPVTLALNAAAMPEILAALMRLTRAVEEQGAQITGLAARVADLSAVRQSLMLKYDAAASAANERASQAEQSLKDLRLMMDLQGRVARLTGSVDQLSRALDSPALAAIAAQIERQTI